MIIGHSALALFPAVLAIMVVIATIVTVGGAMRDGADDAAVGLAVIGTLTATALVFLAMAN